MLTPRLSQIVSMRATTKITRSRDGVLLGADMALSSEELLNVSACGIENGWEVSRRHLDCDSSRGCDDKRKMSRFAASRVGYIFWVASCSRRSSAILAHKFNFVECPARVCNWRRELAGRHQLRLPSRFFWWGKNATLADVLPTEAFSRCRWPLALNGPSVNRSKIWVCNSEKVVSRDRPKKAV